MRLPGTKGYLYLAPLLLSALAFSGCNDGGPERPRATPSDPLIERGAALYQGNCLQCHGGATGGKLKDLPPPHNANGHTWHHADQQLTDMTLNGISFAVEGQQKMPAFKDKLSEEEVKAILAYIKTWWTEDQREWQKNATANWDR